MLDNIALITFTLVGRMLASVLPPATQGEQGSATPLYFNMQATYLKLSENRNF